MHFEIAKPFRLGLSEILNRGGRVSRLLHLSLIVIADVDEGVQVPIALHSTCA